MVALDVLRTLAHAHDGPAAIEGLMNECEGAKGYDSRLDAHFALLHADLSRLQGATPDEHQMSARALVSMIARAVQGGALVRATEIGSEGSAEVAEVFCATRLAGLGKSRSFGRSQYGCLPNENATPEARAAILKRAMPY